MGKDILFSDLLITRAGMLSTKMVYVYGHSVRAKNGQVLLRCDCTGLFASACLYKYFVSCRMDGPLFHARILMHFCTLNLQ